MGMRKHCWTSITRFGLEGFVHNSTQILLGSLKRVLPENRMRDLEKSYKQPWPLQLLNRSSLNAKISWRNLAGSAHSRQKKTDRLPGSSTNDWELVHTNRWFGYGSMRASSRNLQKFRSEDVANIQKTTLGLASVISFSCTVPNRAEPAASNTMKVEVLVHSSEIIQRWTLETWLNPALHPQIVKFKWSVH